MPLPDYFPWVYMDQADGHRGSMLCLLSTEWVGQCLVWITTHIAKGRYDEEWKNYPLECKVATPAL